MVNYEKWGEKEGCGKRMSFQISGFSRMKGSTQYIIVGYWTESAIFPESRDFVYEKKFYGQNSNWVPREKCLWFEF